MNDGSVIRNGRESSGQPEQELSPSGLSGTRASLRSGLGILIFSRRRQLLRMNRRALELTGQLNQTEIGAANDIHLAPARELSAQIHEALDSRKETNISEILELKRVIFDAECKILIRGFGLACRNSHDDLRIVIVLEEIGLRQEHWRRRRRQRAALLKTVAPSPRNQPAGGPKDTVSDAYEWGVPGTSPSVDWMHGVQISKKELQ